MFHQVFVMVRFFLIAAIVHVPISVQDSEISVKMPDNETMVMMKIDIKNNKTEDVDHGVSRFLYNTRLGKLKETNVTVERVLATKCFTFDSCV